jgi:hypothetical protein
VAVAIPKVLDGPRQLAELYKSLLTHRNAFRYCYERSLMRKPTLHGTLGFRVRVLPNGTVCELEKGEDRLGSDEVTACAELRLRQVRFGEASAPSLFELRFTFPRAK